MKTSTISTRSNDIFQYQEVVEIFNKLNLPETSVLDIGCSIPEDLFFIYQQYKIRNLNGVDIASEREIIDRFKFLIDKDSYLDCQTIFECFCQWCNNNGIDQLVSYKKDFENYFNILTNYNISNLDGEKYNIILLIDVLHFMRFSEAKKMINKAISLLAPDGYLILRCHHEQNKNITNPKYSTKVGARSYKSLFMNETMFLFDERGFDSILAEAEKNGINSIIVNEKIFNETQSSYKSFFMIGKNSK